MVQVASAEPSITDRPVPNEPFSDVVTATLCSGLNQIEHAPMCPEHTWMRPLVPTPFACCGHLRWHMGTVAPLDLGTRVPSARVVGGNCT